MNLAGFTRISFLTLCVCGPWLTQESRADDQSGVYVGGFAGLGKLEASSLRQTGAVILPAPLPHLPIDAKGPTDNPGATLGGVQLGYEWPAWRPTGWSGWGVKASVEVEGVYLKESSLDAAMPIQPRVLGTQHVSMDAGGYALLAGLVVTMETPWSQRLFPYLGVSTGSARIELSDADSANPSEPGINHFNSDPDATDRASVLQLKLGVKGSLSPQVSLFAEYRHLRIDRTRYTFGSTDYPGEHLPTKPWNVQLGKLDYNFFVAGLQYRF